MGLGRFNKAEVLFDIFLKQATDQDEKARSFFRLGNVKNKEGKFKEVISLYKHS
jgi:hypothetical protein